MESPPDVSTNFVHRTNSGESAADLDAERYYVVDPDNNALQTFVYSTGQVFTLPLGGEPTRIVRADHDLFVTLRSSGEVVHLSTAGQSEGPVEVARTHVGAEPFDVVVAGHARQILVSLSMENAVVALDADTLEVVDRWQVPGEPRWMVAASGGFDGETPVYVASASKPLITTLRPDLPMAEPRTRELPDVKRYSSRQCHDRDFAKRITGGLLLGPAEEHLYVAGFYVDNFLVEPNGGSSDTGLPPWPGDTDSDTGIIPPPPTGNNCPEAGDPPAPSEDAPDPTAVPYYAPPEPPETAAIAGRFNPTIVDIPLDEPGDATVYAIGSTLRPDVGDAVAARGYPGSLMLDIKGQDQADIWVTMPTMDSVLRVALNTPVREPTGNFASLAREIMPVDARGASSMLIARHSDGSKRLAVWNHLDRRLDISYMGIGAVVGPSAARRTIEAPTSHLPAEVFEGRKMFYTSNDDRVVTPSSGGACANCHFEGRTDGLTWMFEDFPRQTPSLAGRVTDTVPVTWTGEVASVLDEVHATTQNRMGGSGLPTSDASKVASYVDWTRRVHLPDGDPALVSEGRALFEGEAGCVACHSGPALTDGQRHPIRGLGNRDTPTLRGIAATAPYYHDGSAPTLRAVLESVRDGSMGNTGFLTDEQMDALVAYLQTL